MKKLLRKSLSIILSLTMLVGCTGKNSEKVESSENTIAKEGKQIELDFYYPVAVGGPIAELVQNISDDFTKENPNIKVNPVYCGSYAETMTKAQTAIKGKDSPDLGVLFSIDLFTLKDMDAVVSFDEFIEKDGGQEYLNDFYSGFMENGQTEGKTWGIPFQRSTVVLYYNKDAFKEAGLDPNKPPQTWEEVAEYSKKLTKKQDNGETRWGIEIPSTGYQYWMLQALAIQSGKNLMNNEGTETYFNSNEAKESLEYWLSLSKDHKVMPEGIIDWKTVPTSFIEEKTAMMIHTTGNLTNVKNSAKFDFGVAFLPANKNFGSATGGGNFYIFKDTPKENQEAAWKFIKYATSPEVLAKWSIDTGYVAPRKSSYETETLKKYIEEFPQAAVAKDQLEHAKAELSTHNNGEVQKIINDAIQSALTGGQSINEALDKAQKDAEKVLSPFKK